MFSWRRRIRHPYNSVKLVSPSKAPFAMLVIEFESSALWLRHRK